jgi:prepilin-type N-terminal cleavage/methylation domain-containing protein
MKKSGFTLIELMIVIAIIGILAAIAIPNFLKFQCKGKQSEAGTNLGGIFTAEKSFYGIYNSYTTDLNIIHWTLIAGCPRYVYGFVEGKQNPKGNTEIQSEIQPSHQDCTDPPIKDPDGNNLYSNCYAPATCADLPNGNIPATFTNPAGLSSTTVSDDGEHFIAGAASRVLDSDVSIDMQIINDFREIRFTDNGNDCSD